MTTSYETYPQTDLYFQTQPRTATVKSIGGGVLAVTDVSTPGSWTLDLPVNLAGVAAVTLENGSIVPIAELESIASDIKSGQVGLVIRGFDRNTNAILFNADSQNSDLAASNDNVTFRGMQVVIKDLRFGPALGEIVDWSNATTYDLGDIVFLTYDVAYRSLQAANLNHNPFSSPTWWEPYEFAAGDRIVYTRGADAYSFTALRDGALKSPLPQSYAALTPYSTVGTRVFYNGVVWAALQAVTPAGNTPSTSPTYWLGVQSDEWTLRQYLAQISYSSTKVTYAFTYTLVNDWGEEGAPADTVTVDADYGQAISLHGYIDTARYVGYRMGPAKYRIRYYGFASDSQGSGEYKLIAESRELGESFTAGAFGYLVETPPTKWSEALPSVDYDLPPPNPIAVAPGPNGMIALLTEGYVAVCEPYRAWAWPQLAEYRKTLPYKAVGLIAIPGGWLITTTRHAFVLAGPQPGQLSLQELPIEQAGISQKSLCALGEAGVAYASNDGIVIVQGLGASIASGVLFTREQWQERYGDILDKLRLFYHDGRLVGLFPGTAQGEAADYQGFTIRFESGTPIYTRLAVNGSGGVVDTVGDQLLIANDASWAKFEDGASLQLTWQSKDFILPRPENLGAAAIDYTGGPFELAVWANGIRVYLKAANGTPQAIILPHSTARTQARVRLPGGFKAERYSFAAVDNQSLLGWWSGTTYPAGTAVRVLYGGLVYYSIQAGNLNHAPDVSPSWWTAEGTTAATEHALTVHRMVFASTMLELAGA